MQTGSVLVLRTQGQLFACNDLLVVAPILVPVFTISGSHRELHGASVLPDLTHGVLLKSYHL